MVLVVEYEVPDATAPPAEFLRFARLSLLEEEEKSRIDEVKFGHEHRHRHGFGHWHRHGRDHRHDHGHKHRPDHFPKHWPHHDHKHKHKHCHDHKEKCGCKHEMNPCEQDLKNEKAPKHELKQGVEYGQENGEKPDLEKSPHPHKKDPNAPKDVGYFVLITVSLFGLVHMLPLMFFFTANEYWMYKFRNVSSNSTSAQDRTYLQVNFASFTRLTITLPGVLCNFIAAIGGHKINARTRMFSVLFIHTCILISQAVFANIDTDDWQMQFFILTMALQLAMSCAMSLGGSGAMGLIAKLPPRYMKAQLIGEGGSSLFSALLRLVSILVAPSTLGSALMYFITGSVLMAGTSIVFFFATQTKFFQYYTRSSKEDQKEKMRNVGDVKHVLKKMWPLMILITLPMLLPVSSITNLVVSEFHEDKSNIWGTKYFVTVCTYLVPAVTGLIGRAIFNFLDWDCSIPLLYILVITKEAVFGSLTFLSNALPRHNLPVLLTHDWEYALMMAGDSFARGFVTNLITIKTFRTVPKQRIELSMMINMFFLSLVLASTSPLGVIATGLL